jgi:PEP-CTERM motif
MVDRRAGALEVVQAMSRMEVSDVLPDTLKRALAVCGILATIAQPAVADSIFVPGASAVKVEFGGTIEEIGGSDPPADLGTAVVGNLTYAADASPHGEFPLVDFALAFDGQHFTEQDVLSARIVEFVGTLGFDAQVLLAGSGFEPFLLELFREFGDSNLFLVDLEIDARSVAIGSLTTLDFTAAVPEPSSLVLIGSGMWFVIRRKRGRQSGRCTGV